MAVSQLLDAEHPGCDGGPVDSLAEVGDRRLGFLAALGDLFAWFNGNWVILPVQLSLGHGSECLLDLASKN